MKVGKGEFWNDDDDKFVPITNKCKGVKKKIAKKFTLTNYKEALTSMEIKRATIRLIQGRNYQVRTIQLRKSSLSPYDDKRYILSCGIHSIPYGCVTEEEDDDDCLICR